MLNSERVSLVVTTKNEANNLRICLNSVTQQTYRDIELIVVDNFSDDATTAIASEFTEFVYQCGPERSAQRNFGMINHATGHWVMYIDADMILAPRLVENCVAYIKACGASALHVSEVVLGKNFFSRVRNFERSFYDGTSIDGARFFVRDVFVSVEGFDEITFQKGSGEDWDLDKKVRQVGTISLLPKNLNKHSASFVDWSLKNFVSERGGDLSGENVIFHNESEFDIINYLKKKAYYATGFEAYINKWGSQDPDIRAQFSFHYRFFGVFVENGKWKKLWRLDYVIGMYFLRFLVGIVFLCSRGRRL